MMYDNREVFPSAPLEFVAAEVRFPFAPQLSKEEGFEALGSILDRFPLPERESRPQGVAISAEGLKSVEAHVLWRFLNRRRTASVSITPTSLTVETTDYGEYADFRVFLSEALSAIASLNAIVGVERVGLRYIDEIRVPLQVGHPADWSGYVENVVLAPLAVVEGYEAAGLEGAIRLTTGPGRDLLMRYATLEGPGIVGGGPLKRRSQPANGPFFLIDIDSFWSGAGEEVPEFASEDVLRIFDALHEPVGELFLRMITDKFKAEVARKERI